LNIIEVAILWNDVVINSGKFQREVDQRYALAESLLKEAREKKIEKYEL
jgi:hypothetical protein